MLSAAVFVTNPLFAMKAGQPDEREKGISQKACSLCKPKLMIYTDIQENNEKGFLNLLPADPLIEIIAYLPYNSVLALSRTSKIMNDSFQSHVIWEHIAQKKNITVNPNLCIIDQVKEWHSLFGNKSVYRSYTLKISELEILMHEPYNAALHNGSSWRFSIGKNKFQLVTYQDSEKSEPLDGKTKITFCWCECTGIVSFPCFTATVVQAAIPYRWFVRKLEEK